jgi:GMP synthase (glutamine-hydrolysing)
MPTIGLRIHCFQHVPFEGLGEIARWARERGHTVTYTRFFERPLPPEPEAVDFLIIMGGPMNVYEYRFHPWLRAEKQFIERFLQRSAPVLGVCLGAQLIADVLGAKVYQQAEKEIGWFPIRWQTVPETRRLLGSDPGELTVFHWHGDTFDLPPNTIRLAESEAGANQAFVFNERAVGLQFHIEVSADDVATMAHHGAQELTGGRFIQTATELVRPPNSLAACHELLRNLLDHLAG